MVTIAEQLKRGVREHQAGHLPEAEQSYRAVLRADPDQADALHLLGVLAAQAREHDRAVAYIERAIRLNRAQPAYHMNLGNVYRGAGRPAAAIQAYRCALAIDDRSVAVRIALASALRHDGRHTEAAVVLEEAVRLRPDDPDCHRRLASALGASGRRSEAVVSFRRAIRLRPTDAPAHNQLGVALLALGRHGEAEAAFAESVRLDPDDAQALSNLGVALHARGRFEASETHLRRSLQLRPDSAEALSNLGNALRGQGRLDEAETCYREATTRAPDYGDAHHNLGSVLLEAWRLREARSSFLRAIELRGDTPDTLDHLAQACEAMGDLDEATGYCHRALALCPDHQRALGRLLKMRPGEATDEQVACLESLVRDETGPAAVEAHFTLGHLWDKRADYDRAFGHYDAGNRLHGCRFDLGEHLDQVRGTMATLDEAYFAGDRPSGDPSRVPIFIVGMPRSGSTLAEQILSSHPDVYGAGELNEIFKLTESMPATMPAGRPFPDAVRDLDDDTTASLARRYLDHLAGLSGGAAHVTDKAPGNFRFLGLIAVLFPNARVIHMKRHPLDVCLSCYFQQFVHIEYAFDLTVLGGYYRAYEQMMDHWSRTLPIPVLDVEYEALVADQQSQTRRMLSFCDLPWDERCLAFERNRRPVQTASVVQVRQPIYRTSVARWRHYERHLGRLRAALGGGGGDQ